VLFVVFKDAAGIMQMWDVLEPLREPEPDEACETNQVGNAVGLLPANAPITRIVRDGLEHVEWLAALLKSIDANDFKA
jgi:hypothetical protein